MFIFYQYIFPWIRREQISNQPVYLYVIMKYPPYISEGQNMQVYLKILLHFHPHL